MMDVGGHISTGGWILSILGILILVALIVAVTVLVVSAIDGRRAGPPAEPESARAILDRRLARGELSVERYDELRTTLDRDGRQRTSSESETADSAHAT